MAKIAMLHTSFVFLNVETGIQDLIGELLPEDELIHFVDSDVLATVVREGRISSDSEARMVLLAEAAERAGADVIFSACSSLGPAIDGAKSHVSIPIVKIDDAMTLQAALTGTRIGVLATVPTTLAPTANLIREHATSAGREIEVVEQLADGAFDVLMSGDKDAHDAMVLASARDLATRDVDLIVLAQASMSRLREALAEATGLPVLSSPRLGVEGLSHVVHPAPAIGGAARN
jgi:Asp/Glu/hydantoin racemase